ncbi:MAG: bifunctional riboflavin kinase/FAD synthetase [Lachnospiraceae bacterium]
MQIIKKTTEFMIHEKTAVAIGKFDGIHLGHKILVDKLLAKKKEGFNAVILTFDPLPDQFFGKEYQGEITTKEEKRKLFEALGIDVLIEWPLNGNTSKMDPCIFVEEILIKQMNMAYLVAGYDVAFGNMGSGNAVLLKELSQQFNFELEVVDKIYYKESEISSSLLRSKIKEGDMEAVTYLMGAPFAIEGEVIHGRKLGRTLGVPTANTIPSEGKILPPFGVYFSEIIVNGNTYYGITNIGRKPTISTREEVGLESFLFDFHDDIYGERIHIKLLYHRRGEKQFKGIEMLKETMEADILAAKQYHQCISNA